MAFNNAWPQAIQNSSGLSLRDDYAPTSPDSFPFSIEHMSLAELMLKNRAVRELHNNWTAATTTAIETTQVNNALQKENAELKAEIQRLKTQEGSHLPYAVQRMHSQIDSISPSDSVSRHGRTPTPSEVQPTSYNPGRSAIRPNNLLETVLWNFADIKSDPDVIIDPSNANRPPMQSVIRHENGELIDSGLYKAIRASGQDIVKNELFPMLPKDKSSQHRPRTMKLFKDVCREAWNKAIRLYEAEQPLLALCSNHWKAEHMLQSILTSIQTSDTRHKNNSKRPTSQLKGKAKARQPEYSGHERSPSPQVADNFVDDNTKTTCKDHTGKKKRPRTGSSTADTSTSSPLKKAKGPQNTASTLPVAAESLLQLQGVGNGLSTGNHTASAPSMVFETDMIVVSANYDDLKSILSKDFAQIKSAQDLLSSMKACPDFRSLPPSEDTQRFLARIETADPNDTSIDEDNKGVGWGHYQFTAGSMTCASVLKSWEDVSNTTTARKLIASTIRTCKVARFVCEKMGIQANSYISDSYLERVIETLWDLWKLAGAPTITTTSKDSAPRAITTTPDLDDANHKTDETLKSTAADHTQPEVDVSSTEAMKDRLESLVKEDLKNWIDKHKVAVKPENKLKSKDDLVSAILCDPSCKKPTQVEADALKAARSTKRKPTGKK